MRRTELVDHIKGSYLKKQYLEAFLVQSAYIEGLLKIFADHKYWKDIVQVVAKENYIVAELRKRIKRFGINELIDFLFKTHYIDDVQKQTLNRYKEKRNKVLHDLVLQMSISEFDKELKETCELGDKIIDNQKFKDIEKILDDLEEMQKLENKS